MESAHSGRKTASEIIHRRETFRYIALPMLGVLALVVAGVVVAALLPERLQVSILADWLFSIMFLCPMVLCLFPFCVLMIFAVVAMNRAHSAAAKPLRRLEAFSATLSERAAHVTDSINRKTVDASVRLAFVERLLGVFDPPSQNGKDGDKDV